MEIIKKTLDELHIVENLEKQITEFTMPHTKQKYLNMLKKRKYSLLFAIENKKEAGYAVSYGKGDKFYIWTIAVLQEYRNKGVAKQLLQRSMEEGKKLGYSKIYLKTKNTFKNMIFLALKFGFKISNVAKKEDPDQTMVWMERTI